MGSEADCTEEAQSSTPADGLNRRAFVAGAAGSAGAALVVFDALGAPLSPKGAQKLGQNLHRGPLRVSLYRREDFMHLEFALYNLKRSAKTFKRKVSSQPAYVVVTFLPQALGEEAFLEAAAGKAPGIAKGRMARASRLAFRLPAGVQSFPATVDGLLAWSALKPNLSPAAAVSPASKLALGGKPGKVKAPKLRAPESLETAIELPLRLVLSPTTAGRWSHATAPLTHNGWTELWHTKLSGPGGEGGAIRATWNYDRRRGKPTLSKGTPPPELASPFLMSLDINDRYQIVRASSDFGVTGRRDVQARRLWLSSMGGFLDSRGVWDSLGGGLNLQEWKHQATLGRDHYVKVVKKGFIFPFGHRCVKTTVTERRFESIGGQTVATLRQFNFITIKEPVKSYAEGQSFGVANDSRDFPFRSVEFKTLVTPHLDGSQQLAAIAGTQVIKVKVPGDPFRFHLVGTDWAGRRIDFTAGGVFFPEGGSSANLVSTQAAIAAYEALGVDDPLRTATLNGESVAMAKPKKAGDTDVEVKSFTIGGQPGASATDAAFTAARQPRFYPRMQQAVVRLAAVEQAAGGAALDKVPIVSYPQAFIDHAFDAINERGGVFLQTLADTVPKVLFGGGSAGGVMTPNLAVTGLSRQLGPVAGSLDKLLGDTASQLPAELFKDVAAKILGGVDLIDLIADYLLPPGGEAGEGAFKIVTKREGLVVTTELSWKPKIKDNPIITAKEGEFAFSLVARIKTDLEKPDATEVDVEGKLEGFAVNLLTGDSAFIIVRFKQLSFKAGKGQKPDVDPDIDTVEFVGALEFVNKLKDFLNFAGEGGPKIDIQPSGITATMSIGLPSIGIGLFSISNIRIGAGFNLPFDGTPARFRFDFSTRDDPFALQVAIFGGTGFFGLAIGTDGVELIEAALEFGAMASFNIGVASGGVHLLAGVYFSYGVDPETSVETCILTGYVRLGGELSILGLIKLSLEFYMGLTYIKEGDDSKVYGEATLTVEISILFFSFDVSLSVRKEFGGGGGGGKALHHGNAKALRNSGPGGTPTFADQIAQVDWDEYCDAFSAA